jgi:hypothetical protein
LNPNFEKLPVNLFTTGKEYFWIEQCDPPGTGIGSDIIIFVLWGFFVRLLFHQHI